MAVAAAAPAKLGEDEPVAIIKSESENDGAGNYKFR